jgi:23S rRNA-intervening sequence protein
MPNRNYTDLIAWQKAMNLAESVYKTTKTLPREEQYGLTSQMRRAAVSIPSNIAEGEGRRTGSRALTAQCGEVGRLLNGLMNSLGRRSAT